MIRSYKGKIAAAIMLAEKPRHFPPELLRRTREKLVMLGQAVRLDDLKVPTGNRLEALRGSRQGQHSIRINEQWRICFVWRDGDVHEVEILDYHRGADDMNESRVFTLDDVREGRVDLSDDIEPGGLRLPPVRPGDLLQHEFLDNLGLTANALALALRVPANRITAILNGTRAITADTALRLARYFGTSAELWMNLQRHHDLEFAQGTRGDRIRREVLPRDHATAG